MALKRKSEERELRVWIEQMEAAETILADFFSGVRIIDVDEHVLFGMTGEKARKDFDELFLLCCTGMHETIAHIQPVWPFCAIQAHPVPGTVVANLVQPISIFGDPRFNFLEA